MPFKLTDVTEWNDKVLCVPTALCAITGVRPADIAKVISLAAQRRGVTVPADPYAPFNINDWLRAIKDLGGDWCEIEDYSNYPYTSRPMISQYLRTQQSDDLFLVFGENREETMTHVFAMSGNELVDIYTEGKIVASNPETVPDAYNEFRVKRVFLVWDP